MAAPDWIKDALAGRLEDGEEITSTQELDNGLMSEYQVVSTSKRGFVVRNRALGTPTVWPIEIQVPGAQPDRGASTTQETTTEPLPGGVKPEAGKKAPKDELGQEAAVEQASLTLLDGIGPARAETLHALGIQDFTDLVDADPDELANELRVSADKVRTWQRHVDLTRVRSLGPRRTTRLATHGIHTIPQLTEADADALADKLGVPQSAVETWQREANEGITADDFTQLDGIGETRADQLIQAGVRSFEALIEADPEAVAEELGVSADRVQGWQQDAISQPDAPTDLLDVDGIGPARACTLFRIGVRTKQDLADADASQIADQLRVNEDTIQSWQEAAS